MEHRRADHAPDRILVHGLKFVGHHGVFDEERRQGNRFRVDVAIELDTRRAGASDVLGDTVDYRQVATEVLAVGQGPSHLLIESLAEEMAARLLALGPVMAVELTLRKHALGIPGEPGWVAVQIRRERGV